MALGLAGLVVLAGCGSPAALDVDRAEARIATVVSDTFDVTVGQVRCPEDVSVEAGATFACAVEVGEASLEVRIVQADDEGALRVEPTRAVLVTARVENDIVEVLADRFARDDVEVSCPGPPERLEEAGSTFTCLAVDGEEEREVEVQVRDVRGALTYTLV